MNLKQLMTTMRQKDQIPYKNLTELIEIQYQLFTENFELCSILDEQVRLTFNSKDEAQAFYMDCNYGSKGLTGVSVLYDLYDDCVLILKPVINLAQLLKHENGLISISKRLRSTFKLDYVQAYTNHRISLYLQNGEILDPKCELFFYEGLPYLSLGRLYRIMSSEHDFYKLNTTITVIESQVLL